MLAATFKAFHHVRWMVPACFLLACPMQARGQDGASPDSERYSFVARGLPLATALELLWDHTAIDIAWDPPLVEGKRASCAMEEATKEDLLRCVLEDTGLDFYRLSSGLYVLAETPETIPLYGGLQGIVLDAETRLPLSQAHVLLAEHRGGTTSNDAGRFAFSRLKPGRHVVIATHVGYRSARSSVEVPPGGQTSTELTLESKPITVKPVVVDGLQWRLPSEDLGAALISGEELADLPAASGGILAGLNTLLGVRVSDATAGVHIQGGESGEHQLTLDGAPIFLPLHFASFLGPFSPFAIGDITVHKAGFGVSHGSQISGVIDIQHDLHIPERRRFDVQLDPLSTNARLLLSNGRPERSWVTFMAAGRMGLWNIFEHPPFRHLLEEWSTPDPFLFTLFDRSRDNPRFDDFGEAEPSVGDPHIGFRDLHAAARVRFTPLSSLHASGYFGQSRLGTDQVFVGQDATIATGNAADIYRDRFRWDTGAGQVRYESVLDARTFASINLRGSYYGVQHDYSVPNRMESTDPPGSLSDNLESLEPIDDGNRLNEVAARARIDHTLDHRNDLTASVEIIRTGSRFSILGTQRFPIHHDSGSWRIATFLEDEMILTRSWTLQGGSRATYLAPHRRIYLEPRLALRYDQSRTPLGALSMRFSGGLYRQFVFQFDVSNRSPRALVSDTRFWLVADSTIQPALANHYAAEILVSPSPAWSFRLESYLKRQHRIMAIDYGIETNPGVTSLPQDQLLRTMEGSVYGVGAQIRREFGLSHARLRYEYSRATRLDTLYSDGYASTVTPWNEPHRLELALDIVPFQPITLLVRWQGVWGRTWGFRQGYYDFVGAFGTIASDVAPGLIPKAQRQIERHRLEYPEEHALPPIYQLDLSLAGEIPLGTSSLQIRADVLNVFNRMNEAEWHLIFDADVYYEGETRGVGRTKGYLQLGTRPLLERLISVALKWSF